MDALNHHSLKPSTHRGGQGRVRPALLKPLFAILLLTTSLFSLSACDVTVPHAEAPPSPATPSSKEDTLPGSPVRAFPHMIAESRIVYRTFDEVDGQWTAYKINADGTDRQRFDFPRDNPSDYPDIVFHKMRWSPDGTRLVYRGSNTNTDNWYLVLIDSSGTWRRLLTPIGGFVDNPLWSPQGDRMLYGRGGYYNASLGVLFQSAIVDTTGTSFDFYIDPESHFFEGDSVFYSLVEGGGNALYDGAWAPGGQHLYVTGAIGKRRNAADLAPEDIEVFKVELSTGRTVERVTHNTVDESGFILSPDGTRMILTRNVGPDAGLYLLSVDGMRAVQLVSGALEWPPRWAADSRHVVFQQGTEIFLIDVEEPEQVRQVVAGHDPDIHIPASVNTGIERR